MSSAPDDDRAEPGEPLLGVDPAYHPTGCGCGEHAEVLDGRQDEAIATAVAMAVAGNQRDLHGVYAAWESVDPATRVDVLAALAQLPAWLIDQLGGNATEVLADTGRQLATNHHQPQGDTYDG